MHVHGVAVRQQLREELLARAWAVFCVNPCDGKSERQVEEQVAAAATRWSALLCASNPVVRRRTAESVQRMLWPTFRPADEWWQTPLGEAVSLGRAELPITASPSPAHGCPRRTDASDGTHVQTHVDDQDQLMLLSGTATT